MDTKYIQLTLESSDEYLRALEEAARYKSQENPVPVTGFTRFTGKTASDQVYPNCFNFLISLNLQLLEKVNRLIEDNSKLIKIIEKEKFTGTNSNSDLERITTVLENLSLGGSEEPKRPKIEPYRFWKAKKYE